VSLATLMSSPVLITRRLSSTTADDYGNEIPDEQFVETLGCLQQKARTEPAAEGELSITDWILFLPVDTVLRTGDLVTMLDTETDYEVIGDPENMTMGSPAVHHVEATVRRTAGSEDGPGS
jgi:hypothetical protein